MDFQLTMCWNTIMPQSNVQNEEHHFSSFLCRNHCIGIVFVTHRSRKSRKQHVEKQQLQSRSQRLERRRERLCPHVTQPHLCALRPWAQRGRHFQEFRRAVRWCEGPRHDIARSLCHFYLHMPFCSPIEDCATVDRVKQSRSSIVTQMRWCWVSALKMVTTEWLVMRWVVPEGLTSQVWIETPWENKLTSSGSQWGLTAQSLHVLPASVWFLSGFYGFLP